jgi:hypothetical protein
LRGLEPAPPDIDDLVDDVLEISHRLEETSTAGRGTKLGTRNRSNASIRPIDPK